MPDTDASPNRKLKLLYLSWIFRRKTDENHSITVSQIIAELKRYGIPAERKAVYNDIQLLKVFGMDIVSTGDRTFGYFLASRDFELPELKLLADAVSSARFLTEKKSRSLLKKIESLASVYEEKEIQRQVFVSDRVKAMNERIYLNVDKIHRAINENKQISFRYFDYGLDKKRRYRDGLRIASPYALTWDDERYYLVAFYSKRPDNFTNFRVDRMEDICILDEKNVAVSESFSLSEYLNSTFSMFSGETQDVKLRFDNSLVNVVIDRFGKEVRLIRDGDDFFTVTVKVKAEQTFFGWLFQFADKAEIISPCPLREKYLAQLQAVTKLHKKPCAGSEKQCR